MTQDEPTARFQRLRRQLNRLPEAKEPPPTTLQLLGRNRQEDDWQRYLAYFLTPDAPHGIEYAAVEKFLEGLADRDDIDFAFSRFDLDEIEVATEVPIPDGRLDLLIWSGEEWFVFCELKVDSTEGDGQTRKYAGAD